MGKKVHDDVLDGAFDVLDQANLMLICSAEPSDRANALTLALADVAVTPNTDFTKGNGDVSGRKVTVAAKPGVLIDTSGAANHIALCDGTRLLYVTTCATQALVANGTNTVDVPAWDIEIADPV
jgi:hypothetical protein